MADPTTISPERRLARASARRLGYYQRLQLNWAANLEYVTRELVTQREQAGWASFGAFWLRLHGTLVDLRRRFAEFGDSEPAEHPTSPLAHIQTIYRLIVELRDTLTEDELIYVDYRRNTEAHPVQDAYELRGKRVKDEMKITHGKYKIGALEKEFEIEDLHERLEKVLRRYHASEIQIAIDFATRVHPATVALLEAFQKFNAPTR